MSRHFSRGLVVGKFSPLHLGHELVIATALDACDDVIVLSYSSPEFPRCDAAARERWLCLRAPTAKSVVLDDVRLARLCATNDIPVRTLPANSDAEHVHREFVGWLLLDVLRTTVDAVFTSEAYGDGFADSLTQQFRSSMPSHRDVAHVCVDASRTTFHVSGTAVRQDPPSHRSALAPEIYVDLVPRLCLLGGESTGKTTLAQALARRLDTTWVAEYGRERWLELGGGVLGPTELLDIARTQVRHEVATAQTARGWLVCDTSPLTTLVYGLIDHSLVPEELHQLARRAYDLVFLCDDDLAFTQDGTRRDDAFRTLQQHTTVSLLRHDGVAFTRLRGSVDERVEQVLAQIALQPTASSTSKEGSQ